MPSQREIHPGPTDPEMDAEPSHRHSSRRVQIDELRKECGGTVDDILAILDSWGYYRRSESSTVAPEVAQRFRAEYPPGTVPSTRPAPPPPPPPITAAQAAELFGVPLATIRKWVQRGYLKPVGKAGRAHLYETWAVRSAQQDADEARPGWRARDAARERARGDTPLSRPDGTPLRWNELVSGPEAARLLKVRPQTIRTWVHRGKLTPAKPGTRPLYLVYDLMEASDRLTNGRIYFN